MDSTYTWHPKACRELGVMWMCTARVREGGTAHPAGKLPRPPSTAEFAPSQKRWAEQLPHLQWMSSAASRRASGVRVGRCTHMPGENNVAVAAFSTSISSSTSTVSPWPSAAVVMEDRQTTRGQEVVHACSELGTAHASCARCRSWRRLSPPLVGHSRATTAPSGLPTRALCSSGWRVGGVTASRRVVA